MLCKDLEQRTVDVTQRPGSRGRLRMGGGDVWSPLGSIEWEAKKLAEKFERLRTEDAAMEDSMYSARSHLRSSDHLERLAHHES